MLPLLPCFFLVIALGAPALSSSASRQLRQSRHYDMPWRKTGKVGSPAMSDYTSITQESSLQSNELQNGPRRSLHNVAAWRLQRLADSAIPQCDVTSPWDCARHCQDRIEALNLPCNASAGVPRSPYPEKGYFAAAAERQPNARKNKVLCFSAVAFILETVKNVLTNIWNTESYCDWALLSYSGEAGEWWAYVNEKVTSGRHLASGRVRIVADLRPVDLTTTLECEVPFTTKDKLRGWKQLAEDYASILDEYVLVHLLDDDMALTRFNFDTFLDDVACGLPLGPPLVSQPTTSMGGDIAPYLTDTYWERRQPNVPKIIESSYVGTHAPLLVTHFFQWAMDRVYLPQVHLLWDAHGGLDHVWCNAARHYMVHVMGIPVSELEAGNVLGCAIYPRTPMRTYDFKHLGNIACDGFASRAATATAAYRATYPFWWSEAEDTDDDTVLKRRFMDHVPSQDGSVCRWRDLPG